MAQSRNGTLTAEEELSWLARGMTAPPAGEESCDGAVAPKRARRSRSSARSTHQQRRQRGGPGTDSDRETAAIRDRPGRKIRTATPAMITRVADRQACAWCHPRMRAGRPSCRAPAVPPDRCRLTAPRTPRKPTCKRIATDVAIPIWITPGRKRRNAPYPLRLTANRDDPSGKSPDERTARPRSGISFSALEALRQGAASDPCAHAEPRRSGRVHPLAAGRICNGARNAPAAARDTSRPCS